jgi:hypothetical protein
MMIIIIIISLLSLIDILIKVVFLLQQVGDGE